VPIGGHRRMPPPKYATECI